jgi:putative transposase
MPNSYTPVHIHFVWATFDRKPLLLPEWENRLHGAIGKKCEDMRAQLLAVNSMPDHMHVLVRLPATVSLAQMAMHLKGVTSHLINSQMQPDAKFQWQEPMLRSVSARMVWTRSALTSATKNAITERTVSTPTGNAPRNKAD